MNKIIKSFSNSCNGLKLAWVEDHSFRNSCYQFIIGFIIACIIEFTFNITLYEFLLLIGSLFPIVIVETINTSIEAVTDKASPERSPLAKKTKDIGSAAVLLTRLFTLICWIIVLVQHVN